MVSLRNVEYFHSQTTANEVAGDHADDQSQKYFQIQEIILFYDQGKESCVLFFVFSISNDTSQDTTWGIWRRVNPQLASQV